RLRRHGDGRHLVHAHLARFRVRAAGDHAAVPLLGHLLPAVDLPAGPAAAGAVHASVPRRGVGTGPHHRRRRHRCRRPLRLPGRPFTRALGPPATLLPDSPTLYLGATGPGVAAVGELRDRVFQEPLERTLTWPFVPHVTLADEMAPERIEAALTSMAGYVVEATFERVHLLEEGPGR